METILNIPIDNEDNNVVRQALLNVCTKNPKLAKLINKIFEKHSNIEISAFEDYGWEWDVECYGADEGGEMAICNHDYRDDEHFDGDGWEINNLEELFYKYFDNFNWDDIRLDNGKLLLCHWNLEEYITFQIVDQDLMEDGKVDMHGISWN